ncbi:phage tail length tape measure family protein [Staphylococcus aureus]|nr:phage tail length tape measure family protein [Staphylococcus aureus]
MDIAELGYKVDSSGLVEGTKALDENAAAADRAGAAADRLEGSQSAASKTASYWANEQAKINARVQEMERIEQRATVATRQAATATEAHELNLQQLLGQINPTVAALNKLAEQQDRLARARDLGLLKPQVWQQYQNNIDATRASILNATGAQNGMGMSARQLQNNLRMIPMQVTDITTSLISGQPAWMVAIQQGGQLKDQFGGIGPAARAVGGYVLGLINPLTLGAAALAALAISAKQAEDQLFDFQKAQILSGQATSIGAAGFLELASSIDHLQGVSRGGAVAALTETAKAGRYAGEQFEMVAAAAARMEASAGRSLSATVSAFDTIAKEPVEGLLKLNDAERFLTAAQLQRIVTLKEEGRSQEAANEAIQIYASHLDDVANRTEAVMPAMSKGWRDIKADVEGAWGALGNFTSAVVDLAGEWGILARLPRLSDVLGLGLAGGTLVKNLGLPSLTDALNGLAAGMRGLPPLPKPIDEGGALDPQTARDLAAVTQERASAEQAAAEAINAQVAGLDRASAKEAARLKIIAQYNKLADNDARHVDGSMQRLIAKAQADVDKSFNRRDGVGKRNGDDSAAQNMLAAAQRQIEANKQLVETGVKVTESERQAMAIEQVLAKGKNTMTASTRTLLTAAREELLASGQKAAAYTKEKEAAEALARQQAILAQASSNRARSNELDLMGMGRGSDAVAMLRRQLDIQREYQDELKRIGSRDVASDKASWDLLAANAAAYRDSELAKERTFQEQRLAMLGDWRAGVQRAWEDYSFAAGNALEQANSVMNTALSGWEDAWVRFAQTGKLSFRDMANAIIADLARIAAKQAAVGIINAVASAWGGSSGVTAAGNAAATSGTQSINEGLLAGYGGGRARGGPVSGSTLYEVGEGGKPELFNDGRGRTYLIPGNDGQVIPAAPASAGGAGPAGGAPVINVSVVVSSDGSTETDANTSLMDQFGRELGQFVDTRYRQLQLRDLRSDGVLGRALAR